MASANRGGSEQELTTCNFLLNTIFSDLYRANQISRGGVEVRAVMDTNVLVAALRSRQGASFEIFRRLRLGEWTAVLSNHLLFEYEEILKRQALELGLSLADVDQLLNGICASGEECFLSHSWQPILSDPDDEPLVQLAIESDAFRIVSHNVRHLRPAVQLGVELLRPREFLDKLRL
jgi:putative PIN family toxin of toxin-antitoxin system